MHDLFSACLTSDSSRTQPGLAALLYSYCPAAVGFWRSGVSSPTLPYDAAWHALTDYSSGADLKTMLAGYGLENLIGSIKEYIAAVTKIRHQYPALRSPELLPIHDLVKSDTTKRIHLQPQIGQHFGGNWKNVFEYARVWAFVLPDWTRQMLAPGSQDFSVERHELLLRIPELVSAVSFPAFVWQSREGLNEAPCIGFICEGAHPDPLRCMLGSLSVPQDGKEWERPPRIFALDPSSGMAQLFESKMRAQRFVAILSELASAAARGPYLPLPAWNHPTQCRGCPFHETCMHSNLAQEQTANGGVKASISQNGGLDGTTRSL